MFLLDSGASHNFLSRATVDRLGLKLQPCAVPSIVKLANQEELKSEYFVETMVTFGHVNVVMRFEVLACSVTGILGIPFLQ